MGLTGNFDITLITDSGEKLKFSSFDEMNRYTRDRIPTVNDDALRSIVKAFTENLNLSQEQEEQIFNDFKAQAEEHLRHHWPSRRN